jgi:hypothetical protein
MKPSRGVLALFVGIDARLEQTGQIPRITDK